MTKAIELKPIEPEYVYVTIPAEYVCVYHRLLVMLSDYGEEMLKDCKASCKDRNSGIIECFNMFNAAVASRKIGKDKLAETLIKYIKAKINQIYKGVDNSTSIIFPVDEDGQLKAFVSCGDLPKFWIDPRDMMLYNHKFGNVYDEHFKLGPEDGVKDGELYNGTSNEGLIVDLIPYYEKDKDNNYRPCADVTITMGGNPVDIKDTIYQYYFDNVPVKRFDDVASFSTGEHQFSIVVTYKGETVIVTKDLYYGVN